MTSPERRFNPEWIKNQPETGIREADPELLARRTVQSRVQVYKINPGSRAEAVGLKKGDIIRSSNGNNIDFKTRWNGEDIEHPVTLSVENTEGEVREIIVQRPFGCVLVEAPIEDRDLGNNERMVSLCLDSYNEIFLGYAKISRIFVQNSAQYYDQLLEFTLFFKGKNGKDMQVDLLKRLNSLDVPILLNDILYPGLYVPKGSYILLQDSLLRNDSTDPDVIHVLAHELRHAYQHLTPSSDQSFEVAKSMYVDRLLGSDFSDKNIFQPFHVTSLWNALFAGKIVKDIREAEVFFNEDIIRKFNRTRDLQRDYTSFIGGGGSGRERSMVGRSLHANLQRAIKALPSPLDEVRDGLTYKDIMLLPSLRIERDAEYGALIALRALREDTGIDLLTSLPQDPAAPDSSREDRLQRNPVLFNIDSYVGDSFIPSSCVRKARLNARKRRGESG